ncbi:hypothetical protein EB796_024476 [Bugula neritina]|uniref:Uncharacterized protein n=1 Tax=Bugula neritina TaxID=10212 RepID=A0A7J7ITV2_BUGNE|nr:hypothetical protein EB796_024476 [Bugula neritina]
MFDYTTDYMGSEVCTTNQTVTTECSCGYIWSEWGSCDCSSDKQERNRCAAKISEVTSTTMATSTHANKNTNETVSNTTSDMQEETTPDPGELIGLATSEYLVTDDPWCISEKECGEYCPYYSLNWDDWEECNCQQNRRFLNCLFPSNPSGISIINPICEEPLAEYKDCNDPGCYSDWSDWAPCPCGVSHSSRTRECLDEKCSQPVEESQECQLNELTCWYPWSTWSTCLRDDNNCGRGGVKNRTRIADCSSTPNLSDICSTKNQTEFNESCIAYTCTKYGQWGEWDEWNSVKLCGKSNQTRNRYCEYSYRTVESWSKSTCDDDCWQCIVDESENRCTTDECREKSCYRDVCTKSCLINNGTVPSEFDLTIIH